MKKRLLAYLLSLCMVLSLIPATAMAGSTASFTDVSATDWYYQVVTWAAEEGIMDGATETTFAPETNATRGEIVYALHQLIDAPEADKVAPFLDVTSNMDCADAVAWAAENKVVSGYDAQTFGPNDPVTREQMSAILYRFAKYLGCDTEAATSLQVFSDYAKVDAYAVDAMEWACAEGLFSGMGDGTLNPDGFITRAQVASILYRYDAKLNGEGSNDAVKEETEDKEVSGDFTVTFDWNYNGKGAYEEVSVDEGDTVDKPDKPSRGGYRFEGWFLKKSGGEKFDFDTEITEDITLYAHWDKKSSGGSSAPSHTHVYDQYVSNEDGTHDVVCACGDVDDTEYCTLVDGVCACGYKWDDWDGTTDTSWYNDTDTVFLLDTAEELAGFAALIDDGETFEGKTVKLDADIDLYAAGDEGEPICFDPIGSYRNDTAFKGTFDGQDHTIFNLNQNTWALNNGYSYSDLGLGLFGKVQNATIKNLNMDGAEISGESAICGVVAAAAYGDCTFENITVSNSNCADYQYYSGGVVGWASGEHVYKNIYVDESTTIVAQWGDFDNSTGGIIGGCGGSATIHFEDCTVACRIDAYNDVTSSYQWYAYRRCGMLIGNTNQTTTVNGTTYAAAPQLTAENVTVVYGDWADYHYCEFAGKSWPYVRVEAGVSNSAYSNPRYGHPTDAMGNEVATDAHVHNYDEDHQILCTFDQLYGGGQGVYGWPEHNGVKVVYNNDGHNHKYEFADGTVTEDYTHIGTCKCGDTFTVKCGGEGNCDYCLIKATTLDNVIIKEDEEAAIVVKAGETLNLTIKGHVELNGATNGIQVEEGAVLNLKGTEGSELVITAANGSGIGNKDKAVGTINIDGIDSLTVNVPTDAEKGKHAFGIGGAVDGPITIKNTTIDYINGGCPQKDFVSDTSYGKSEPEGGAAIGIAPGATDDRIILDGVIIKEAVGGSKAAAIGAQYWATVDITIIDCDLRNIVGGNASAAIGGSRIQGNKIDNVPTNTYQTVTINIKDSDITAQGGQYAAGIGSGYDTYCHDADKAPMCTINISGNSVIAATGGKYAAGIGTGHHAGLLSGAIEGSVDVSGTKAGEDFYKESYTTAQSVGFGVLDPAREAKDNDCFITVADEKISILFPTAEESLQTLSLEEDEVIEDEAVEDEADEDEVVEDEAVEDEVIEDEADEDKVVEDEVTEEVAA